jgi:tetratricopeptide (TPR) repeat protein
MCIFANVKKPTPLLKEPLYSRPIVHYLFLFFTAWVFYANTISNEYALDDLLVTFENKFVKEGVGGVGDILTHDTFFGSSGKIAKASGGRYRPLSVVAFALEKQFFGMRPGVFHFFNVLYYSLLCMVLYHFLITHFLNDQKLLAFSIVFLFAIHPVHTEVVANIKSRDEIFSLLFMVGTLHFLFKHIKQKSKLYLLFSLIFLALALLSKEYGIILTALIPLAFFIRGNENVWHSIRRSLLFFVVITGYVFLRYKVNNIQIVEEKDLMNEPYLLASSFQKYATILLVLIRYIGMLVYPDTLSYDYSYNQIPYVGFNHPLVWLSIAFYTIVISFGIWCCVRKKQIGFWIAGFAIALFMVSNTLVNIGAPMADRFLFTSGFFFLVAFIPELYERIGKVETIKKVIPLLLLLVGAFAFAQVKARNAEWKNNSTLYFSDVKKVPNSCRANAFCAMELVNSANTETDSILRRNQFQQSLHYFYQAASVYPNFGTMYQNWGLAYYNLNNIDSARWAWSVYKKLRPESMFIESNLDALNRAYYNQYYQQFQDAYKHQDRLAMLSAMRTAVHYYDKMPSSWMTLAQLYMFNQNRDSANLALKECLRRDPKNKEALKLMEQYQKQQ